MLKLYFNAIYYEQKISLEEFNDTADKMELICQYFLSLFNYMHIYDEKEEANIKNRLKIKYNSQLVKLKDLLKEYISKNKEKRENENYISIKEIKFILDNNNDINIKRKIYRIHYLLYETI